ncbi:uncharacterized protein LOC131646485 [Vicia villosa]|uniref:uncharacterized protein LOC131646485 n=1 Tax=Vicia villosa TaxID=3911 RepID=UPI00273C5E24|nr:uncharacterized protein LOC131646485 [Vicia villosa]
MANTRIPASTVIFFLAFFILTSDMCIKLEGRELDASPCKNDEDCQTGGSSYKKGSCVKGSCWYSSSCKNDADCIPGFPGMEGCCVNGGCHYKCPPASANTFTVEHPKM